MWKCPLCDSILPDEAEVCRYCGDPRPDPSTLPSEPDPPDEELMSDEEKRRQALSEVPLAFIWPRTLFRWTFLWVMSLFCVPILITVLSSLVTGQGIPRPSADPWPIALMPIAIMFLILTWVAFLVASLVACCVMAWRVMFPARMTHGPIVRPRRFRSAKPATLAPERREDGIIAGDEKREPAETNVVTDIQAIRANEEIDRE